MSTSAGKQIVQYGLTEVYTVIDPLVDIVFVHGLNGHPHDTWSTKKPDIFWPADLLPAALEEQRPRILTYGYDANVTAFTDGVSKDRIHNHAEHLASRLVANRSVSKDHFGISWHKSGPSHVENEELIRIAEESPGETHHLRLPFPRRPSRQAMFDLLPQHPPSPAH